MRQTINLKILGFANDRLYLEKPTGEQVATTVDQFEHEDLLAIERVMGAGIGNWNDSAKAPVYAIAEVEIDEASGKYTSMAFMGLHIEND